MRPVNLIPPEERPGGHKPLRSGPLAYIIVGFLAAAVIAITALVVTENSVSDKKAEVVMLKREATRITAKAQELSAYTQFANVREQRLATVTSLADSRFDWARILHELSLVIPANVQLTSLAGSVSSGASSAGGAGVGLRAGIAGPALEMAGCTTGQGAVAGFIEALKDIDGVTRVGFQGSSMSGGEGGGNATSAGSCEGAAQFQLVAAFDAAPVPPTEEAGSEVVPEATTTESSSESSTETTSSESSSEESTSSEGSSSGEGEAE